MFLELCGCYKELGREWTIQKQPTQQRDGLECVGHYWRTKKHAVGQREREFAFWEVVMTLFPAHEFQMPIIDARRLDTSFDRDKDISSIRDRQQGMKVNS